LNPDPIGIGDGVNVYAYCRNNPTTNKDTRGTQTKSSDWFKPIDNLPTETEDVGANIMNFLTNNSIIAVNNMGASILNSIPATYNYLKNSGGPPGIAQDLNQVGNNIERSVVKASETLRDYKNNTSQKQHEQNLGQATKDAAKSFTKLDNYNLVAQVLIFHKIYTTTNLGSGISTKISTRLPIAETAVESPWDVLNTKMKTDQGAQALAKEINGVPQARFRNNMREYDAISDKYIGQHKPALKDNIGQSFKEQAKATFDAAKQTGREVFYKFDGKPGAKVIEKLEQYSKQYEVKLTIKWDGHN